MTTALLQALHLFWRKVEQNLPNILGAANRPLLSSCQRVLRMLRSKPVLLEFAEAEQRFVNGAGPGRARSARTVLDALGTEMRFCVSKLRRALPNEVDGSYTHFINPVIGSVLDILELTPATRAALRIVQEFFDLAAGQSVSDRERRPRKPDDSREKEQEGRTQAPFGYDPAEPRRRKRIS